MKTAIVKFRPLPRLRQSFRRFRAQPGVRLRLRLAALPLGTLLLAAIPLDGRPLPAAAALLTALPLLPDALLGGVGALLGYALLYPWTLAIEPVLLTALCLTASALFGDAASRSRLFAPLTAGLLCACVGFVFLLDRGFGAHSAGQYLLKLLLAAAAPAVAAALSSGALWAKHAAVTALLVGFCRLAPPLSAFVGLLFVFSVAVASGLGDVLPTLLGGLGLDLSGALPLPTLPPLVGAALLCRLLPRRDAVFRAACFAGVCLLWQLWRGPFSLPACAACLAGCAFGALIPAPERSAAASVLPAAPEAELPLRRISRVFAMMHRELSGVAPVACASELSDVYDFAAEAVCRMCVRSEFCWKTNAAQTYEDLCAAGVPILQRGSAVREDFPAAFAENCRHMEGFITAVNQELDRSRCRRQLRNRLQESRRILASQYLFLSRFLGRLAEDAKKPPQPNAAFVPEFAVSSACRPGSAVSGDRGASFRDRWNNYYVLLCDGMGSGEEAAQESGRAVRTLTGLLESGVAPDTALEILNGFYVLQEASVFSTVDLLRVNLTSGAGALYKWGAAPSYLKCGETVKKIGTVSPPPGLSVGSDHAAEQLKLSLKDGETLIMVSDGAFGEATEQRAAHFGGTGVRELATYLVAGLREHSEDDLTAAVLRLVPQTVQG